MWSHVQQTGPQDNTPGTPQERLVICVSIGKPPVRVINWQSHILFLFLHTVTFVEDKNGT